MSKLILIAAFIFSSTAHAEIKNSQSVLGGLLTRAGVRNMKQLSASELRTLCEQGHNEAFFLYKGASEQQVACSRGTISYRSPGDYRAPENINRILNNINAGLSTGQKTFVHCYNGAHASGFVAAIALRTFCGMSGDDAAKYWDKTLGGYPLQEPNRTKLLNRLRSYSVRTELELSPNQKIQYGCPR